MPNIGQVYAYVGGAVLGFVVLALLAFRCLFDSLEVGQGKQLVVASMLHVISTLANLAFTHFLAVTIDGLSIPATVPFALVEFQVTFGYNLLLLVEFFLARTTAGLESAVAE